MNFTLKVKPIYITAKTKDELIRKIRGSRVWAVGSEFGDGLVNDTYRNEREKVRVFNIHKINAKYKQEKHKRDNQEKNFVKGRTKKSVLVRDKEWIAYVYDFDFSLLKLLKVKVTQNTNNFKIVPLKK